MTKDEQRRKAGLFRVLHESPPLLILPNAWDVVSARIYELEGFKAIGTTSAGIAATLGYPDGQRVTLEQMTDVVRRIANRVDVPVSADIEAGYATSIDGVVNATKTVLAAGAVGINLQDSTEEPSDPLFDVGTQVEKIKAIRDMAASEEIPLVVNARTDVYIVSKEAPGQRLDHAIERANAYREAGADCIFVPDFGDLDGKAIATLVKEIHAPLNIIAGERTPPLPELEQMGVARVSFGPRPMRAALALIRRIAREWKTTGTYTRMLTDSLSYAEVNQMLEGHPGPTG